MLEIRSVLRLALYARRDNGKSGTYDRTFENSLDGDITKLSFVLDQDIRCWMLWSSSMLAMISMCVQLPGSGVGPLVKFVNESRLHDLWLLRGGSSADGGR